MLIRVSLEAPVLEKEKTIQKIQRTGTILLCLLAVLGFLFVMMTVFSFALRMKGVDNPVTVWYTQNAEVDLSWMHNIQNPEGQWMRQKTLRQQYEALTAGLRKTVETFCTGAFPRNADFKAVADAYQHGFLHNSISIAPGGKTNLETAQGALEEISEFHDYLTENGIGFLYVSLPSVDRITAAMTGVPCPEEELDLPDRFHALLEESDINFLNVASMDDLISGMHLDISDHWMPADALHTTEAIAQAMNNTLGFQFDPSLFDISRYENALDYRPGTEEAIKEEFGYDFKFWVPKNSPEYNVHYMAYTTDEYYEGDFIHTLLAPIDEWDSRFNGGEGGTYHNMSIIKNGALLDINNLSGTHNPRRVLFLGDSFTWPVVSYLSQDVDEIFFMHPRYFEGDTRLFIEDYKPDTIVWVYGEAQIKVFNDFFIVNP